MMNFKTISLIALLIISVFLLGSCEVYQTLYGANTKASSLSEEKGDVVRLEGMQAKEPENLSKMAYAAAAPTQRDPFKAGGSPLGPFQKGKSLGFTMGQWLAAGGIGIYSVDKGNAELELSFKNLVPNGVYTLWCSRITSPRGLSNDSEKKFPPAPAAPEINDMPCGAPDGSENSFTADNKGIGEFSLKLKPLDESSREMASIIALAYHSNGKTYGASPGEFGLNSHVQLFYFLPPPAANLTAYSVPIKFTNHIDAGMPEQDVFVELEKPKEEIKKEEMNRMQKENEAKKTAKTEEAKTEGKKSMEKMPKEKPVVVVVKETDLVRLVPKADDPDTNTSLIFTFTSPLNDKGEWQTKYGDAGEYTVTVTASDGELTTTRDALIIVNKKEEAPTIDSARPIESGLTIDETQAIDFNIEASDLNKDPLTYNWKLDGIDMGAGSSYKYQSTYDDAGAHTIKADVSDGSSSASKIWSVNVKNVNRKPVLDKLKNINAKETHKIVITALATDADKDAINYSISDKRFAQEDNVFTWQTNYDSAGDYKVVVSAGDGQDTAQQEIEINVQNVNRPPVISDIVQRK